MSSKVLLIYAPLFLFSLWLTANLTTLPERHDAIKLATNNLDDRLVLSGLISEYNLHYIGNKLGVCDEWK